MNIIKNILCITILLTPAISLAHDRHNVSHSGYSSWQENNREQHGYNEDFYNYDKEFSRRGSKKNSHNVGKHYSKKRVQAGWDVDPRVAKRASNCYRYTLSARGGKGSARITSIPGKNYIQVKGAKSGYVCYQGEPTLELGKLGDPNVKVTFQLEGKGSYGFHRGQTGSSYKNHWYRSYWGL